MKMKMSGMDLMIKTCIWLSFCMLCGAGGAPNVILCMTDDQGWGDTGYNGHPVLRTPNLDRMAKEGIRFERFYAGAPVCSPTRGSCLTGRHPYRYGIMHANVGRMKSNEVTLAEVLKTKGYATGHFGKWHLGTMSTTVKDGNRGMPGKKTHFAPPWINGFDTCFSTEAKVPTYWRDGAYEKCGSRYWLGQDKTEPADKVSGDDSKLIMNHAIPFIQKAAKEETPFFAVIWFHAPHLPIVSAPPYTDGYTEHKDYYGCLTAMDEQMGRLRKELETLGVSDNTMLWFCSDNGPEGKDSAPGTTNGLRGRKRSLYEGGIRVPGLLVWPAMVKEGLRVSMPCNTSDYFPTVLDALGYQLPKEQQRPYDGISLMPLIRGKETKRSRPIAFESKSQAALIAERYKIYRPKPKANFELYDLKADPGEKEDLAKKYPEMVTTMRAQLESWRNSCKASHAGDDY